MSKKSLWVRLAQWLSQSGMPLDTDLPAPKVPAVLDPLDPDGLVSAGTQNDDLEVLVDGWINSAPAGASDLLELFWSGAPAGVSVARQEFPGPIDPDLFPFLMRVPKAFLQQDGRFEVWYRVTGFSGSPSPSERKTVTLDTAPPGHGLRLQALLLPPDLTNALITESYLASHSDQVELRLPIPIYDDAIDRDVASVYWSQTLPPVAGADFDKVIVQSEIDASDIRISLAGSLIRASGNDGQFYLTYKIIDRAGNSTLDFAWETSVTVALKPPPLELPEADFPDANLYGYYTCDEKPWDGIKVRIEFGSGPFDINDELTLFWQGYETLNGVDPIAGTYGEFPMTINARHLLDGVVDITVEPYEPFIRPIVFGSGRASYTLVKVDGRNGKSPDAIVKIDRKRPGGEVCEPEN